MSTQTQSVSLKENTDNPKGKYNGSNRDNIQPRNRRSYYGCTPHNFSARLLGLTHYNQKENENENNHQRVLCKR